MGKVRVPVRPEQFRNEELPILITLLGIVRVPVRPEQPENALSLIVVKPALVGRVSVVRPEQPENAREPIVATLLGIVTLVRPVQLANA